MRSHVAGGFYDSPIVLWQSGFRLDLRVCSTSRTQILKAPSQKKWRHFARQSGALWNILNLIKVAES